MALTDKLTAIADAIRAKNGSSAKLTLDEMATAIGSISGSGIPSIFDYFAYGEYTFETTATSATSAAKITHGLGVIPKLIIYWPKDRNNAGLPRTDIMALVTSGDTDNWSSFWIRTYLSSDLATGGQSGSRLSDYSYANSTMYATTTTFMMCTYGSSYPFNEGDTYCWIAAA